MPLTSVNEVKIILAISGSTYDEQIKTVLPAVESQIQNYCFTTFDTGSIYPDGLKLAAAQMCEYILYKAKNANVAGESIGAYSITYNSNNAYPDDIIEMLKPYKKVRFT